MASKAPKSNGKAWNGGKSGGGDMGAVKRVAAGPVDSGTRKASKKTT